jgi:hypothetical protein
MDVVYHLTEDDVFEAYMQKLFDASTRVVVVYSSDRDDAMTPVHMRHRKFTDWVAKNRREWQRVDTIRNEFPYDPDEPTETSVSDFYVFKKKAGSEDKDSAVVPNPA